MRHYKYECPNNPELQKKKEQKEERENVSQPTTEERRQEYVTSESMLSESEVLERIIREVSSSKKIPGIIRMVEWYMNDPKKSFEVLAEALRIGDVRPSDRVLILKNWAAHLKLGDIEKLIENEGKDEDQKKDEKDKKDEIETGDAIDKEMKRMEEDELRQLRLLRMRKERRMLERDLEEPKQEPKKEVEEKQTLIVEGVSLKLTPTEMLAWKKHLSEEKEKQDEREQRKTEQKAKEEEQKEERRRRDEESAKKKSGDTVQWPVGDKVIEVRPETIPMLVMQQTQKKEGMSEDMKLMMEEMKAQREQLHQFQMEILKKENDELKAYAAQDPLDRIYTQKEKLEKLGLVSGAKASAQERMYDMDSKKLDTALKVALDKSLSIQNKVDSLLNTIGPAAQDYVKEMILQMRQSRGVTGQEVARTSEQAQDTLKKLEEVDKAFETKDTASKSITVGDKGGT